MKKSFYVFFISVLMVSFSMQSAFSDENLHYKKKLIKSRAKRGYDNNGTVVYSYIEIDEYSDDLDAESLGNIDVNRQTNSRVREVYNWVEVKNGVSSRKKELSIGEVTLENRQNIRKIDNNLIIDGDIYVKKPDELHIGTISVEKRSRANTIQSTIGIHGKVNVD